jgi:YidC/Oxa1 family membrane protein insertase
MPVFANIFQPLIDFFEAILKFFHDSGGLGWGTSIIALTVLVRICLLPLTLKQYHSMQRLAQVQPEIKKLQDKYKGDKERLNQELMKFYRENKVNPFASCLPMVAQIPVFLSLFYMLQADLRRDICPDTNPPGTPNPQPCGAGGDAEFFFIPDLTDKATGAVLVVLLILYVGSQLLSTVLMNTSTDRTQRMIMIGLPFIFVLFIWQFPTGLLVYWITTNLWTIAQQAIVRKRLGPLRPEGAEPGPSLGELLKKATNPEAATATATGGKGKSGNAKSPGQPRVRSGGPPPPSPRKKRKRSGRRR